MCLGRKADFLRRIDRKGIQSLMQRQRKACIKRPRMGELPVVRKENRGKEMKEFPVPHTVSELICINCKKRWISARPEAVLLKEIQCPKCNKQGYAIETGQVINEGGKE